MSYPARAEGLVNSIIINFLLVHFRNCHEYLTKGTAQVFIPWVKFLFGLGEALLLVWGSLFIFLLSSPLVWWCPLPILTSNCNFPFFQAFLFLSWFGCSIPSVICLFLLFIFLYEIPFLYSDYIFLLVVSESPIPLFNGVRRLTRQILSLLFLIQYERVSKPRMTNAQSGYNDLFSSWFSKIWSPSSQNGLGLEEFIVNVNNLVISLSFIWVK